jgi:desulfoferrodoxin (superoxide reductase-like protein)
MHPNPAPLLSITATTAVTATAKTSKNNSDKIAVITSSLAQHEKDTGHHINWVDFRVVWGDNHPYRLLIEESPLVQAHQPELNRTIHSVPLLIYSAGLPRDLLPDPKG